jgi:hypothetical protein
MSYYRIKIEEKNNGEKVYTPQLCRLRIKKRMFRQTQELVWYNILRAHGSTFGLSTTVWERYENEEGALRVIEDYKNKEQVEEGNNVKSVTYKDVY